MRTAQQRIAKYNARMLSSLIDPTLSAMQAIQAANFTAYELDFYPKQVAFRAVLATYSMPTPQIAAYEAFHGELYHLAKVTDGIMLTAAVTVLVAKWVDAAFLGAGSAAVLKDIANTVYGLIIV
jgi:hypothetical protein